MYAIIETGGKQYKVQAGDVVFIEKLDVEPEQEVVFDKVMVVGKDDGVVVGTPTVAGATVTAKVLKNGKAKAIRFSTLEAICRELNCQPSDIIEYRPEETTE